MTISNHQQQSSANNQQLREENTDIIELLPIVEHDEGSHDEGSHDDGSHDEGSHDEGSHDAATVISSEVTMNRISYQLPQHNNDENGEILENRILNQESRVSETEFESKFSEVLKANQGSEGTAKQTKNAFLSTLTVTMAILR